MRIKVFGALLIACAVSAVAAVPAGAVVVNTPSGRVGYLPLNEVAVHGAAAPSRAAAPVVGASEASGNPPLLYHGGPVMHSHEAFAIFWAPSGHPFPAGYEEAIETYLENVAADSGKPGNVYSVSAQYTDESGAGHAAYSDTYGGSLTDTTAYPTGTCAPYEGFTGIEYEACISDPKLKAEVRSDVNAENWPTGLGAEYYVVLPPNVGSCFVEAGGEPVCFDAANEEGEGFCAYHNFTTAAGKTYIYANISYSPGDPFGCGVEEYPNGFEVDGNPDDTLSGLSHEANESITDPLLNAWFDAEFFENGDECRNSSDDYGVPLGGPSGALFNETIGLNNYFLQQEWSNDIEDCAQRVDPAIPVIADPEEVAPLESVPFDGSGTLKGGGKIVSFAWKFGDGGTATGSTPTHTYATTGEFTVTLTVKDDGDFSYSTTREVTVVSNPQRRLTVSLAGSGSGNVFGTGISCPGICSAKFPNGETVALTATPSGGSTFSGWSGAGCSGTGTCVVTLSTKRSVTATFTAPVPPSGGSAAPAPAAVVTPAPVPPPAKRLRCHKGTRKAKRHGKAVCLRVRHHHKHH